MVWAPLARASRYVLMRMNVFVGNDIPQHTVKWRLGDKRRLARMLDVPRSDRCVHAREHLFLDLTKRHAQLLSYSNHGQR